MSENSARDDSAKTPTGGFATPLWVMLVLIVGYPLSMGPVAMAFHRLGLQGTPLGNLLLFAYFPLEWFLDNSANSWFVRGLAWWIKLWIDNVA